MKLTGGMLFLRCFLLHFRLKVGCEIDWHLYVVLTGSRGLCGWSRRCSRYNIGDLELLREPMLAVLDHSWGLCWLSWAALGASVGGLGRSWGDLWQSSIALGAVLSDLGAGLGSVLGRS